MGAVSVVTVTFSLSIGASDVVNIQPWGGYSSWVFVTYDIHTPRAGQIDAGARWGACQEKDASVHSLVLDEANQLERLPIIDSTYDARNLLVLEGLEAVRKRPGMYVGSTDTRGLMHCLWEIIDNSVDEALSGHGTHIRVALNDD